MSSSVRATFAMTSAARMSIAIQKPCIAASFASAIAFEGSLQRGELVVGLIAEQHDKAYVDHHQHQQHAEESPHRDALAALEVIAGDPPELPAPRRVAGDQGRHDHHADRGEHPGLGHPQRRRHQLVAPIQGRRERFHAGKLPGMVTPARVLSRRPRPGRTATRRRRAVRVRACGAARPCCGG